MIHEIFQCYESCHQGETGVTGESILHITTSGCIRTVQHIECVVSNHFLSLFLEIGWHSSYAMRFLCELRRKPGVEPGVDRSKRYAARTVKAAFTYCQIALKDRHCKPFEYVPSIASQHLHYRVNFVTASHASMETTVARTTIARKHIVCLRGTIDWKAPFM